MMSTVYLIVTVTVNCLSIKILIVITIAIEMVDLNQRLGHENKSTGFASSLLCFQ